METPSRRAFFAISAGGVCVVHGGSAALAARPLDAIDTPVSSQIRLASALNLRSFLRNRDTLGLSAVMAMQPVDGELGSYPAGSLLLFPFKRHASSPDQPAFLPGSQRASPLITAVPMMTRGLAPDEFFCHYVLKAPWQSFISCEFGAPIAREIGLAPWHGNVAIGDDIVGVRWTSSNLNDSWFLGSRWIPETDLGKAWRARIIDGVRRAAAVTS